MKEYAKTIPCLKGRIHITHFTKNQGNSHGGIVKIYTRYEEIKGKRTGNFFAPTLPVGLIENNVIYKIAFNYQMNCISYCFQVWGEPTQKQIIEAIESLITETARVSESAKD